MTKDEFIRKFKSRLENLIDNANAARDAIQEFEECGGDFGKLRNFLDLVGMELRGTAYGIDSMSMEDVEGEE